MNYYEVLAAAAPEIAPSPRGQWITPEQQGGITPPGNLYGSDGMPLPYIQDQGGPRQFYSPDSQAYSAPNTPTMQAGVSTAPMPLRGAGLPNQPQNDRPISRRNIVNIPPVPHLQPGVTPMPLRGAGLPNQPQNDIPIINPPQNLMREPPAPTAGLTEMPRYHNSGESALIRVPSEVEDRRNQMSRAGHMRMTDEALAGIRGPEQQNDVQGQTTLLDMLRDSRFAMNPLLARLLGIDEAPSAPLSNRPGSTVGADVGRQRPITDARPQGSVQRTSAGGIPDFSTDQGLTEFNYRMFGDDTDRYLTSQYRSQATQDDLYNRHLTNARHSAHTDGRAFDYPASRLSGRRGREAILEVQRLMQAANPPYDINQFQFLWESGRGRGQGTGPHVHVEPK